MTESQKPLTKQDTESLKARSLTDDVIEKMQLARVDDDDCEWTLGYPNKKRRDRSFAGIWIPYLSLNGSTVISGRIRRDLPDYEEDENGGLKEARKYMTRPGDSNRLYRYPGIENDDLYNLDLPIFLTEGEFKAAALCRLLKERGIPGIALGLSGVYNWRQSKLKNGIAYKGILSDFDYLKIPSRDIFILFDSDAKENKQVRIGRERLKIALRERGAEAYILDMPQTPHKGIDDLIAAMGDDYVAEWLQSAIQSARVLQSVDADDLPALYEYTHRGSVERLARFNPHFRYCLDTDEWLFWDGRIWSDKNATSHLYKAIQDMGEEYGEEECGNLQLICEENSNALERLKQEAGKTPTPSQIAEGNRIERRLALVGKKLEGARKFFASHGNTPFLKAVEALLKNDARFATYRREFDSASWLLACSNGTLDLRRGVLRPFSREDYLTHLVEVAYDPKAVTVHWRKFLNDFTGHDHATKRYVLAWLFYSLTGDARERAFTVWVGPPGSGKGTLSRVMNHILGNYHLESTRGAFCVKEFDNIAHQDFLFQMRRKRFVVQSEVKTRPLDSELIKQVTGGDKVYASAKGKSGQDFYVNFTLNFFCNKSPQFDANDDALAERMRVVPCTYQRTPEEIGNGSDFEEKLLAELPGILAYIVRVGGSIYRQQKLKASPLMLQEQAALSVKMDHFREWLLEHYEVPTSEEVTVARQRKTDALGRRMKHPFKIARTEINGKYDAYCRDNGYRTVGRDRKLETLSRLRVSECKIGGTWYFAPLIELQNDGDEYE